jgi:hypothetical protein
MSPKIRKLLFAAVLALIFISIVFAAFQPREWIVPDEAKHRPNPLQPTPNNLRAAFPIYTDNCSNCHGQSGKGDGPEARQHRTLPPDFSDPNHLVPITDGELFYKISEGHRPMPSYKRRLTEDQRWQLILLLRSFAHPQNPPASTPPPTNKP